MNANLFIAWTVCACALSIGCVAELSEPPPIEVFGTAQNPIKSYNDVPANMFSLPRKLTGSQPLLHADRDSDTSYYDLNNNVATFTGGYEDRLLWSGAAIAGFTLSNELHLTYSGAWRPANVEEWRSAVHKFGTVMQHLIQCALTPSQSVQLTVTDSQGNPTYAREAIFGKLGLAPGWSTGGISSNETAKQKVTACLLAHTNKSGFSVGLSLRSKNAGGAFIEGGELAEFPRFEGAFYGDFFRSTPQLFACRSSDQNSIDIASAMGRACSSGGCDGIVKQGNNCAEVCTERYDGDLSGDPHFLSNGPGGQDNPYGFSACSGGGSSWGQVLTVFISAVNSKANRWESFTVSSPSRTRYTCPSDYVMSGVATSSGNVVAVLCKLDASLINSEGATTYASDFIADRNVTRGYRNLDWNGADKAITCGEDEYMTSLSTEDGHVAQIQCKAAWMGGNECRPAKIGSGAAVTRPNSASGSWWGTASPTQVFECDLNERMNAVSHGAGADPQVKGILCCTP